MCPPSKLMAAFIVLPVISKIYLCLSVSCFREKDYWIIGKVNFKKKKIMSQFVFKIFSNLSRIFQVFCYPKGFPNGSVGKESVCNSGDTEEKGSTSGSGRSPGAGHGNPLLPSESHEQRSQAGCSPWNHKESHDWSDWACKIHEHSIPHPFHSLLWDTQVRWLPTCFTV